MRQIMKLEENSLVQGIKTALIQKNINKDAALTDAAAWIAELSLQVQKADKQVSAGYCRRDTSHLTYLHPHITATAPAIVDDGSWIATGRE